LVWQALISPRLALVHASAEKVTGDRDGHRGAWKVTLVVQNEGWLPTYVSKRALARKVVRGLMVDIELPEDAKLTSGRKRDDYGQLEGRAYKQTGVSFWPDHNVTGDRIKLDWIVEGRPGDQVRLVASHERAGTVRASVVLA
jgi:hypothetical protein